MSVRRLVSVLSVCVLASASFVAAAPKKDAKKGPVAPAKDPAGSAAGSGSGSGSGSADAGPPPPPEEPPPADMNGTGEDPSNPHSVGQPEAIAPVVPVKQGRAGYPIEEALRPITLPQNMSEIAIGPHLQVQPFKSADALRARYGITRQIQLGLTYVLGGIYHSDPVTNTGAIGFHPGKAVGLDVTVLLQNWIGVRLGVPVYINPVAVSIAIGVPLKFTFGDKLAIGGMDDLLNISVHRFAPSFYQEADNAAAATTGTSNTEQSRGFLRFTAFAIYQSSPQLALILRGGIIDDLGPSGGGAPGTSSGGGATTFLRAGLDYSPRRYFDIGFSLGFDDLGHGGTFGPAGYLAIRI